RAHHPGADPRGGALADRADRHPGGALVAGDAREGLVAGGLHGTAETLRGLRRLLGEEVAVAVAAEGALLGGEHVLPGDGALGAGGQHVVQRDAAVAGELARRRLGEDPADRDLAGLRLLGRDRAAAASARRGGAGAVADEGLRLLAAARVLRDGHLLGDLLRRGVGVRLLGLRRVGRDGSAGRVGAAGRVGRAVGRTGGGRAARRV